MKTFGFAALAAFGLLAVASSPSGAAEACPGALSANNPAFGPPRTCANAPAKPVTAGAAKSAPTAARKPVEVKRDGGRTVYDSGDTTIAVGGYVAADITTGRTRLRP